LLVGCAYARICGYMELWSAISQLIWIGVITLALSFLFTTVLPRLSNHGFDLRSVVQELNKARATATESTRALRANVEELQSARFHVATLSAELAERSNALDETKKELDAAKASVEALRSRLAASETRQEELQDAAEKATAVRWELASRFGNNEEARAAALNDLRRPRQRFAAMTSRPVEKTASDSILLLQRPDLSVSDSETTGSASDEFSGLGIEADWMANASSFDGPHDFGFPGLSLRTPQEQPSARLHEQRSYPPAAVDVKHRRTTRRRTPGGSGSHRKRDAAAKPLAGRTGQRPVTLPVSDGNPMVLRTLSARGSEASAQPSSTPRLVELQRAPWTASPEASEARRGLAMEGLLQHGGGRVEAPQSLFL
jgi:hypothetical protein